MVDLEMLKKFCGEARAEYSEPFNRGDHTYATNGFCMVRIPKIEGVNELPDGKIKNLTSFFEIQRKTWIDIKQIDEQPIACRKCDGTGKAFECKECEGEGEVELENDYSYYQCSCQTCGGKGSVDATRSAELQGRQMICTSCSGTGKEYPEDLKIQYGEQFFNPRLIAIINELPSAQIAPGVKEQSALFRFDGGEGVIMPVRC